MLDRDGHIELGYDPQRREQHDFAMSLLRDYLRTHSPRRILDLGCGFGEMIPELALASIGSKVVGLDLTARSNHTVAHGDALALPFRFGSFDLVVCLGLIEHVADPVLLLRQISSVAHRGHALIMTPNLGRPRRLLSALRGERLTQRDGHRFGYDYHLFHQVLRRTFRSVEISTRFVDAPFRWLSHSRRYRRRFAMAGSELYAWCTL